MTHCKNITSKWKRQ